MSLLYTLIFIVALTIYIFLAAAFIEAFIPENGVLQAIAYIVMGVTWIFPNIWVIKYFIKRGQNYDHEEE